MADFRTVFLATDGRHVTIGRGDDHDLPPDVLTAIQAQQLRGWLAVMDGSPYGRKQPKLSRIHAVEGATDAEWDTAVASLYQSRNGAQP